MPELFMPGARRMDARSNRNMVGGPAKATHHITDDELHKDGTRIATLDGVAGYLVRIGYEPHVVIDPFTGESRALLDALSSGYAMEHPSGGPETNRQGTVNLQVEWLFTPGTVYNGKRYAQLADTPMLGLDRFLAWCDSWGVPRVSPSTPGDRDPARWREGGHAGHFNAPLNTHVDPISSIASILAKATPVQETFVPGTCVLTFNHSGLVLDVAGQSTDDGAPLVQWTLTGNKNQLVRFEAAGGGLVFVRFEHSGKVLDHDANAKVLHQVSLQAGNRNQLWRLNRNGCVVSLESQAGDLQVLDLPGLDMTPGTRVSTWAPNGGLNQLLTVTEL